VKIVDLVGGDRRSPEQRESYVSEGALLCRARSPVLTLHYAIVRCRTAERDPVPLVVGTHTGEGAAPGHSSFEIVDVRRLQVRPGWLITAAVLIQPRNRVGIGAAVRRQRRLLRLQSGRRNAERRSSQGAGSQELSSTTDWTRVVNRGHRLSPLASYAHSRRSGIDAARRK
jgi:hypothetical protein